MKGGPDVGISRESILLPMFPQSVMRHRFGVSFLVLVLLGQVLLFGQSAPGSGQEIAGPSLVKLVGPAYPPIARAAHISGAVEVDVLIGADGQAKSAQVISGPRMLQQASLEAARQSQYACRGCSDATHYKITFIYKVIGTEPPKDCDGPLPSAPQPEWDASRQQATAFATESWTCDPVAKVTTTLRKARTAKCLYLWKCGLRPADD